MTKPAAAPSEPPEPSRWLRWTLACTVGLAPAALAMPLFISVDALPPMLRILGLALFGAFEGLALGWAQAVVLTHDHMIRRRGPWVAATMMGSSIAYIVCALGMARMPAPMTENLTPWVMLYWGGHGALIGLAQWAVLRRDVLDACPWPVASGLAWMVGQNLIYPSFAVVAAGAGAGILIVPRLMMGLLVGAVTGMSLVLLTEGREEMEESRL